jgi:hypothetical protein
VPFRPLLAAVIVVLLTTAPAMGARNPVAACQRALDDIGVSLLEKVIRIQQRCLQRRDAGTLPSSTRCILDREAIEAITDARTRAAIVAATTKARAAL